jgi:hypothetical protein
VLALPVFFYPLWLGRLWDHTESEVERPLEGHVRRRAADLLCDGGEQGEEQLVCPGQRRVAHDPDVLFPAKLHQFPVRVEGVQLKLVYFWKLAELGIQLLEMSYLEVRHPYPPCQSLAL